MTALAPASLTDASHIRDIDPMSYPSAFLAALANPSKLWEIAFRKHISSACQHLLFVLFFSSQYGVPIAELRAAYDKLHRQLCASFGESWTSKDFEEALKLVEGSFITITNQTVNFINPSLRDYLAGYLRDTTLLIHCAKSAQQTSWARSLWDCSQGLPLEERRELARAFLEVAEQFTTEPVWSRSSRAGIDYITPSGLSNTARINLLLEWWTATQNPRFWNIALALAEAPVEGLDSWRDGGEAIELVGKLRDGYYFDDLPDPEMLADRIEVAAIAMIQRYMPIDELER